VKAQRFDSTRGAFRHRRSTPESRVGHGPFTIAYRPMAMQRRSFSAPPRFPRSARAHDSLQEVSNTGYVGRGILSSVFKKRSPPGTLPGKARWTQGGDACMAPRPAQLVPSKWTVGARMSRTREFTARVSGPAQSSPEGVGVVLRRGIIPRSSAVPVASRLAVASDYRLRGQQLMPALLGARV